MTGDIWHPETRLAGNCARGNVRFTFREMNFWRRLILVCGGLLLAASAAFGQGEYQQTKDGKTQIWNGNPKPGETATWDGDRDKENYATGFGALTYYTARGSVFAHYYGNMVHGKLEGPVNVHTNGKTAHAYFVDGGRVTNWSHGPAPSKMGIPEEAVVEKRKVQAEKEAAATKKAAAAEKKAKIEAEKARSVEAAASKPEPTPEDNVQKAEVSAAEKPAPEAVKKEPEPVVAEKPSEPPTTPSPTRKFDEPTPIPAKSEIASQPPPPDHGEPRKSEVSGLSESPQPFLERPVTESTPPSIQETPPATQESATESKSEITRESSPASTKTESSRDVSLNSLVGPPSSLRTTSEASAPKTKAETSTSRDNAPLTETEAISLADTEARIQGFHLDDYQRPKVDHSAVKGRWSLFYGLKEGSTGGENGPLTVTVEDKTRKVEIRR